VGRVIVAVTIFGAAALSVGSVAPTTLLILAIAAIAAVALSAVSFWVSHVGRQAVGLTFFYIQALFDLALVTTVVHLTEGPASQFPALYVLVIAASAILMPLRSGTLITILASLLYLADITWWQPVEFSLAIWLQIAVFMGVFVATGLIGSRFRQMGEERAELQEEVRRLRLEAGDILSHIPSGVITIDGAGRIVYINPAAAVLLDLDPDRAEEMALEVALAGRAPVLIEVSAAVRRGNRRSLRRDGIIESRGRSAPIGVTANSIGDDPYEKSVTMIFTDISNQMRLEELRRRTERLEAVAEMSASLAHEIRNPLASIRSSIEQLGTMRSPDGDERFLTELVLRESDRLSRLLSEFLDFSRVQVTAPQSIDLGDVTRRAVAVVMRHPDCPQNADVDVSAGTIFVDGDEDLLHRVVANLVLNAVQVSEGRPHVSVEVRPAEPSELPAGLGFDEAVLLRVADRGPGIPSDIADRLFDPFVSGREGGSGLGLAIVQRAVEAHRGVVLVESPPGQGAEFRILLPAGTPSEVAA
jgi:two-component system sensor histidine kinase PilS (NtrC family)